MSTGKINVAVENIFPLIKKFLYSDHEIFLRELISNATDATTKLQHLSSLGEIKGDLGDLTIEVKVDKKAKKIHIIDKGVGMSQEEVQKYINEVAFSGAEEFLEQYKDSAKDSGIIGHFGLGFYSAFMVAEKVEIKTQSQSPSGRMMSFFQTHCATRLASSRCRCARTWRARAQRHPICPRTLMKPPCCVAVGSRRLGADWCY